MRKARQHVKILLRFNQFQHLTAMHLFDAKLRHVAVGGPKDF